VPAVVSVGVHVRLPTCVCTKKAVSVAVVIST